MEKKRGGTLNLRTRSIIEQLNSSSQFFDKVDPFEMIYERISVVASIDQEKEVDGKMKSVPSTKKILNQCSGKFAPGTFTAILGPSGCGKTTMLNLLSGRLISDNLELRGIVKVNGQDTPDISVYKSYMGYVVQEDYILPTFTPYQSFKFIAEMRLPNKSDAQKQLIVTKVISLLGLDRCKNTYVGDTRIRGISGGERKRTSIGLQLLVNPSILFLDQPTTGLDSTTAFKLVQFLNQMARAGRTIISTIHQPSSEIFAKFQKILLIVDGNVVYNGSAQQSINYFGSIGMKVPSHSNPADHYMKLMNKQGIMLQYIEQNKQYTDQQIKSQFRQKVGFLISKYKQKPLDITNNCKQNLHQKDKQNLSWCQQTINIFKRSWINQFRQPADIILKIITILFFAAIGIILYEKVGKDIISHFQNITGLIFFISMSLGFTFIFASLNLFNLERPIFIRQRLSNTYSTSAYFWGRSLAILPIEIFFPFVFLVILYFAVPLDHNASAFFLSLVVIELLVWMSSAYGLVLSTLFKDVNVAMALVPVLIIPFMLVAGYFTPLQNVHDVFRPFEYLSMFKYSYQGLVQIQFQDGLQFNGQTSIIPSHSLESFNFEEPFWLSALLLALIGLILRGLSLLAMYIISSLKVMPLEPPIEKVQNNNQVK